VLMEINASPYRLDLDWRWLRRAKELGILISINPTPIAWKAWMM